MTDVTRSPSAPAARPASQQAGRETRIAVVGGALTGPAAALLLAQLGYPVTVYDARAKVVNHGGGVISLEHSALEVLDRIGIDRDEYVADPGADVISEADVADRIVVRQTARRYPGQFVSWDRLHSALVERLPTTMLRTRARVRRLTCHRTQPTLVFSGASQPVEDADLVIFADGRRSAGRAQLDPDRKPHFAGYIAVRGSGPAPVGPPGLTRLQYPGAQFNAAPLDGGCDWTYYLNVTRTLYADLFGVTPEDRAFVSPGAFTAAARTFVTRHAEAHLPANYAGLVRATELMWALPVTDVPPPTQMTWPIGNGHAVLLGDALAPVRALTGRGANNGIEQAAALSVALAEHRHHGADLAAALRGWQRRALPLAAETVKYGVRIGQRLGLGPDPALAAG